MTKNGIHVELWKHWPFIHVVVVVLFGIGLIGCKSFSKIELPNGRQIDKETENFWTANYSEKSGLNYVATFPKEYSEGSTKKWPMIVFLHSTAERGNDINLVINNPNPLGEGNGIAPYALQTADFKYITITPLCPKDAYWPLINDRLKSLIEDVIANLRIQEGRIYLTGVSMGGMGVWSLAMSNPNLFSAIAPISGGVFFPPMIENIQALKDVPVWAFHDRYDPDISIDKEQGTIDRLKAAGFSVKYTISEMGKHYIHEGIFAENELFEWFDVVHNK